MIVGEVLLFRRRSHDRRSLGTEAHQRDDPDHPHDSDHQSDTPTGPRLPDDGRRGSRRPSVVIVPPTASSESVAAGIALDSSAVDADDTTVEIERRDDWLDADTITSDADTTDGGSGTRSTTTTEPAPSDQLTLFDVADLGPAAAITEQVPIIDLTGDVDVDDLTAGHVTATTPIALDSRIAPASVGPYEFPRLPLRPFDLRRLADGERTATVESAPVVGDDTDDRDRPAPVPKWDRPAPPRDWRWYVGILGRTLTSAGLLLFAFVAYQLYGTAIENAAAQRALEDEFAERLSALSVESSPVDDATTTADPESDQVGAGEIGADEDPPGEAGAGADDVPNDASTGESRDVDVASTGADPTGDPTSEVSDGLSDVAAAVAAATPATEQILPAVEDGAALFQLRIPAIGVDDIVVAGIGNDDLKKGPGHFPDTPMPGQLGNAAIAGHRTTYGQPFHDVDDLEIGDEITVNTWNGTYVYRVTGQQIVPPSRYEVVATTDPATASLTLISCHPKFTAQERIVITSELVSESSDPVGVPVLDHGRAIGGPLAGSDLTDRDQPLGDGLATEGESDAESDESDGVAPGDETDDAGTPVQSTGTSEEATIGSDAPIADSSTDDPAASGVDPATQAVLASLASAETTESIADAFGDGWFSDPAAFLQILLWGMALVLVSVAAYAVSRRVRRDLVGALVGVIPFVVALYFFFQNVHRLLPPNL